MNPLVLGGILKQFYENINMYDFSDRLKVQKIIFLIQWKGFKLGYHFGLYLYGPYCAELTRDAFQIVQIKPFVEVEKVTFADDILNAGFKKFASYMEGQKNDVQWLEIAASYLFIKGVMNVSDESEIMRIIKNKRTGFDISDTKIREVIRKIKVDRYLENAN